MRHANAVRTDVENILQERHKQNLDLITREIEKACTEGKFKVNVHFNKIIDEPTKNYLKSELDYYGYKHNFNAYSSQRDGTVLEVSW